MISSLLSWPKSAIKVDFWLIGNSLCTKTTGLFLSFTVFWRLFLFQKMISMKNIAFWSLLWSRDGPKVPKSALSSYINGLANQVFSAPTGSYLPPGIQSTEFCLRRSSQLRIASVLTLVLESRQWEKIRKAKLPLKYLEIRNQIPLKHPVRNFIALNRNFCI